MSGVLGTSVRDLRTYPRSLWVLFIGTFVYCAGSGLAFPLEGTTCAPISTPRG